MPYFIHAFHSADQVRSSSVAERSPILGWLLECPLCDPLCSAEPRCGSKPEVVCNLLVSASPSMCSGHWSFPNAAISCKHFSNGYFICSIIGENKGKCIWPRSVWEALRPAPASLLLVAPLTLSIWLQSSLIEDTKCVMFPAARALVRLQICGSLPSS